MEQSKRRPNLTIDQKEQILSLKKAGKSRTEISLIMNLQYQQVCRYLWSLDPSEIKEVDEYSKIKADYTALRARADKMEQALKEVRIPVAVAIFEFIKDCAKNWDHDTDGHRYDTGCRMCDAKSLYEDLKKKKEALDEQPTTPQQGAVTDDVHEKEVMMKAFDDVRKIFEGRAWIMEGRGSYPYNDDRYKEEVRYLYNEFDAIQKATWAKIKSKSIDYRHQIIADYLNENKQQRAVWVKASEYDTSKGGCIVL